MKFNINSFGKYFLRMPMLTKNSLFKSSEFTNIDEYFRYFLANKEFLSAIYTSSEDFHNEIICFINGDFDEETDFKRTIRFRTKLAQYINRACTRSTPFGELAGCALGNIEVGSSNVGLSSQVRFDKSYALDGAFLTSLVEVLQSETNVNHFLSFSANNSIYNIGHKFRYVEYTYQGEDRVYNLATFGESEYLSKVLSASKTWISYSDLVDLLIEDADRDDVEGFIDDLIKSKIILSEFEPTLIGSNYHNQVLTVLRKVVDNEFCPKEILEIHRKLEEIHAKLQHLSEVPESYLEIMNLIHELRILHPIYSGSNYIQIDSKINLEQNLLSFDVVLQMKRGMKFFFLLTGRSRQNSRIANFIVKYNKKYDGRSVRLVEALDPEFGIGYGSFSDEFLVYTPLVDDIPIPKKRMLDKTVSWNNKIQDFLYKKILAVLLSKEKELKLEQKDFDNFEFDITKIHPTLVAFTNLYINKKDNKTLILFKNWGSDTAATMLARFSFLDDGIDELLKQINTHEERLLHDNQILAEINHLPNSRVANITSRTKFRNFQISYVSNSSDSDAVIDINNLYIKIIDNKVRLFDREREKEIIPILSNAHNFNNNTLPIYRFLSDLQNQSQIDRHYMNISLGFIEELLDFIPRISFENFIFRAASWKLYKKDFDFLWDLPPREKLVSTIQLLIKRKIPTSFYIVDGDNKLLMDFQNAPQISLILFEEQIAKNSLVLIEENIADGDETFDYLSSDTASYSSEFVVPFYNDASVNFPKNILHFNDFQTDNRFLPLGTDCLFLKIFCGTIVRDQLLTNEFPAFLQKLRTKKLIDRWFFVRYAEDSPQLRVRFFKVEISYDRILREYNEHFKKYIFNREIYKTEISEYDREIERYGGGGNIVCVEKMFEVDSNLHMHLLPLIYTHGLNNNSWIVFMGIFDKYLQAFQLDLHEKLAFTTFSKNYFAEEFNSHKTQKRKLIEKFRVNQSFIEKFMDTNVLLGKLDLTNQLNEFKYQIELLWKDVRLQEFQYHKNLLIQSILHMSLLRGVISKNRIHEYVIYTFLEIYYRRQIALFKYQNDLAKHVL